MSTSSYLEYYKIGNIVSSGRKYEKVGIFPQVLLHNKHNEDNFLHDVGGKKVYEQILHQTKHFRIKRQERVYFFLYECNMVS